MACVTGQASPAACTLTGDLRVEIKLLWRMSSSDDEYEATFPTQQVDAVSPSVELWTISIGQRIRQRAHFVAGGALDSQTTDTQWLAHLTHGGDIKPDIQAGMAHQFLT